MKHTNRKVLAKGLKNLAIAIPLIFLGPSILYSSFNNQDHPLYLAVLILGIAACIGAIILLFRGILIVVKAVFD